MEYIYIRTTETQTAIHFGTTTDYKKRYKVNADEVEDKNKYLHIFKCNKGTGHQIEADFKKMFKSNLFDREIYFWNNDLREKYLHFIRTHKDVIDEVEIEEEGVNIVKKTVNINKVPSRKIKQQHIMNKSRIMAKAIQNDNSLTEITEHDEYYTRYKDVVNIVSKFDKEFENKVVFCNCDDVLDNDDTKCSAFALYFKKNFKRLKLKKLICTHFVGVTNLFNQKRIGYIYNYDGTVIDIISKNGYNGSFYHPESIRILNEEADIVCTNPPWSLTDRFMELIFASKKKYLVILNSSKILDFKYIGKTNCFEYCKKYYNKHKQEQEADGAWYTNFNNIPYNFDRLKIVPLAEIPEKYKKVDDNGILIFDNGYIPSDYNNHFAISKGPLINGILEKRYEIYKNEVYFPKLNGENGFRRILIKKELK